MKIETNSGRTGYTYLGLFVAILAVSWASIIIRWCQDTPALVISFYRMLWSFLLYFLYTGLKHRRAEVFEELNLRDYTLILLAGILLALHFITWIVSLQWTTVAHSLLILSSQPVFALILSPLLLGEKGSRRVVLAILMTVAGVALVAGQDLGFQSKYFLGDLLALTSALFVTLYMFVARSLRAKINLAPYLAMVYGAAAATLFITLLVLGVPILNYPIKIHLLMLLLALVPTGIGHSLLNWTARRIEVYKVNIALLGELVLASIMAYIFFGEKPFGIFYVGAGFVLIGIVIAVTERKGVVGDA